MTIAVGSGPFAVAINQATNKIYTANNSSNDVTVIDGVNNSTTTVTVGSIPFPVAVNPVTNKVYVPNINSNNVTVITPAPSNAIPLNTTVAPLAGNMTTEPFQTFTLTATSTYSPNAPQPQNIYYQVDTTNGAWTKATNTGSTATTLTATATPGGLLYGIHTLYFFAADGSDATSINPSRPSEEKFAEGLEVFSPESSATIGGINAYQFLFAPAAPTAASVSISGQVRTEKGRGIGNVRVSLLNAAGEKRSVLTNPFGYYLFDGVNVGQTYILNVRAKRYQFNDPTRVLFVTDEIAGEDFIGSP